MFSWFPPAISTRSSRRSPAGPGEPLVSRGARVQSPRELPMATMPCVGASLAVRPNGIMALTRGHWAEEMVVGRRGVNIKLGGIIFGNETK